MAEGAGGVRVESPFLKSWSNVVTSPLGTLVGTVPFVSDKIATRVGGAFHLLGWSRGNCAADVRPPMTIRTAAKFGAVGGFLLAGAWEAYDNISAYRRGERTAQEAVLDAFTDMAISFVSSGAATLVAAEVAGVLTVGVGAIIGPPIVGLLLGAAIGLGLTLVKERLFLPALNG